MNNTGTAALLLSTLAALWMGAPREKATVPIPPPTIAQLETIGAKATTNDDYGLDCYGDKEGLDRALEARATERAEDVSITEMARSQGITLGVPVTFEVTIAQPNGDLEIHVLDDPPDQTFKDFRCWATASDAAEAVQ